jgi:DNA polymerase (family 10)
LTRLTQSDLTAALVLPQVVLNNATIAELLVREAESSTGHLGLALRRAAREAFLWPEEATDLATAGRSLTELDGIGPSLARRIHGWIERPPHVEPPPLRREFITRAQARRVLAKHPGWQRRLKGDLQMHTRWSDGAGSIQDMATAAIERGYRYIAITDHTRSLKIAGGMDESRLREQGREIDELKRQLQTQHPDFTILRSAEVNLSPTGEGDMPSSALAELDLTMGCFHSALRTRDDQTARYLAGLRNPDIHILGHPQTRVYNRREGLQADWNRVFGEAARLDKAVEIDGYVDRQDLRISLLRIARREGVRISLGTDAHHPDQFAFMELSLASACLAKISPDRIINFLPVPELRQWIARLRALPPQKQQPSPTLRVDR